MKRLKKQGGPLSRDKETEKTKISSISLPQVEEETTQILPLTKYEPSINEVQNLIAYNISTDSNVSIGDLKELNFCVRCLQSQIFKTNEMIGKAPFEQQNIVDNKGTVRIQGLFETSSISGGECSNLLSGRVGNAKVAIKAFEGNPNGTLACSLSEALQYLSEETQSNYDNEKSKATIETLYTASRGEKGEKGEKGEETEVSSESTKGKAKDKKSGSASSYKSFGEDLLSKFWQDLTERSDISTEEKLSWIMRVYGPLLNKGLSDISQAGELAKYYILKYLQDKQQQQQQQQQQLMKDDEKMDGDEFWEITNGRPSLAAFSSDTIASALGVRIQNIFKGQFQSILPRKLARTRSSVIYIPYKYISLMGLLSGQISIDSETSNEIEAIKSTFSNAYIQVMSTNDNISPAAYVFSNEFFLKFRDLVNNIYKYYKLTTTKNDIFSKNILEIIDEIIDEINKEQGIKFNNNSKSEIFINIINSFNIFELIYDPDNSPNLCFTQSLNKVKEILINFGKLITNLSYFVKINNDILTSKIDDIINSVEQKDAFNFPSWTGILYSTIAYYDNCYDFKNLTTEDLLNLYLQISVTEESCAEQDTDYGHDQTVDKIQAIGIEVANLWLNKQEQNDLRKIEKKITETVSKSLDDTVTTSSVSSSNPKATQTPKAKKTTEREFDEGEFSKNLIDKLKYCSAVLTYDRSNGEPFVQTLITKDPDEDYMFNKTSISGIFASRYANNIDPIGNIETWGSIDYTVGDPLINLSKYSLNEGFLTHTDFLMYIKTENMIEIRTPATNFDAAAPSGCFFKTTEKMAVSYRKFTPIPGSGSTDKKEYMYVILTYDLDDKYQNNLVLEQEACVKNYQPTNLFIEKFINKENDKILELMIQFSRKYEYGNQNNNAWRTMWNLLEIYYKIPGSKLKKIFEDVSYNNIPVIQEIKKIIDVMNVLKTEANKNKKKFTDFRQASVSSLLEIIKQIGDYYLYCLEMIAKADNSIGTEEEKGEKSNIPCDNKLVEDLMRMLNNSNRKNISYVPDEIGDIITEIDPLTSFIEMVKNNTKYQQLVSVANILLEVGEQRSPKKSVDYVDKLFSSEQPLNSSIERYARENDTIIDRVNEKTSEEGMSINRQTIEKALNYARMFATENGVNFDDNSYNIDNKVVWTISVINKINETDLPIILEEPETEELDDTKSYTTPDDTKAYTTETIIDDIKANPQTPYTNKKRKIKKRIDAHNVLAASQVLTNIRNKRNLTEVDMFPEQGNESPSEKRAKNFGGKLKTRKISKKYKNKLTRRKLKYKNKKTHKKSKNLKNRYSRNNKY